MRHVRVYVFILLFFSSLSAKAETFRLGLLHGDAEVFAYEISVLQLALDNADGDHRLEIINLQKTTQERILNMLEHSSAINVFFTGYSIEREKRFLQVNFPITRGLLGHRVFITREDHPPFEINTLQDLQQYSIGSGIGWPDTIIFQQGGFKVIKAIYESLWRMLDKDRFDLFNRGINEAHIEIEQQKKQGRRFKIVDDLMVSYPYDYFIYLNRNSQNLHDILTQGLQRAYENGSFIKNFNNHPAIATTLELTKRGYKHHFVLDNPLLSENVQQIPAQYWYQIP